MKLVFAQPFRFLALWVTLLAVSVWTQAADEPVSTGYFNNVVSGGHDMTAYFELEPEDKAIKGSKTYKVRWKGADWHFVTKEDSEKFSANPERFAPAYNGHCANALSLGEGLINTNGKYWAIFDDELHLFFAPRGAKRWKNGNWREYKEEANSAWNEILGKS